MESTVNKMRHILWVLLLLTGFLGHEFDREHRDPHSHPDKVKIVRPVGCNREGCDLDGNHIHEQGSHEELPIGENEIPGSQFDWYWFRVVWQKPNGNTVGQSVQMPNRAQAEKFAELKRVDLGATEVVSVEPTERPWNANSELLQRLG
jgi:hypothetical protein